MYTAPEPLAPFAQDLRAGTADPEEVLDRIQERFEAAEASISAFVPVEDRWGPARRELATRERSHPEPGRRPALFGVPVGVKDVFNVDGYPTRAGTDLPAESFAGPEATVVERLTDAGAVVIGKTVTAEFAYFDPGPTRNPHDVDRTPGGSSSGSAAAVAAGLCPLALGTQTIGSVARPAAFCGVVGVKPTYGRLPGEGVVAVAPSVDTIGFFTADVDGARLAASVCYDDWRPVTPPGRPTVGVVEGAYLEQASGTARAHFQDHVERLETRGFQTVPVEPFPAIDAINERHESLVAAEAALAHTEWYTEYADRYAKETRELIERGLETPITALTSARRGREELREDLHEVMQRQGIDVLVSPSAPGPAPLGIESTGDPVMNLPWTHAGLPTVTVPASRTEEGLPMGLQCASRFGADEELLVWAREICAAL